MLTNDQLPIVDTLEIHFEFKIRGKGRPRFDSRSMRCYMCGDYLKNKEVIGWVFKEAFLQPRKQGSFLSADHGYVQRAVGLRKRRKAHGAKDAERLAEQCPLGGWCFGCAGSPDLDNLIGTIMDAANMLVYADDRQVVASSEERVWAEKYGMHYKISKVKLHDLVAARHPTG